MVIYSEILSLSELVVIIYRYIITHGKFINKFLINLITHEGGDPPRTFGAVFPPLRDKEELATLASYAVYTVKTDYAVPPPNGTAWA